MNRFGLRRVLTVLLMLTLLGASACGSDHDQSPYCDPCEPPPCTGCSNDLPVLTLVTDSVQIPADGTTLTNARVTFTDARGIALAGVGVRFTADVPDVTWADADEASAAAECLRSTGADGAAACAFRAAATPGPARITAVTLDSLGLAAAADVDFVR